MTHHASPPFDNLELAVITVARGDPLTGNMGPKARAIAWLFGIKPPNSLADPRLEALRRLVIALRRPAPYPELEISAALASGFSQDQIDWLARAGLTCRSADVLPQLSMG